MRRFFSVTLCALAVAWSVFLFFLVLYSQVIREPSRPSQTTYGWGIMPFIAIPVALAALSLVVIWREWHPGLVVGACIMFLLLYSFLLIFSFGSLIFICVPLLACSLLVGIGAPSNRRTAVRSN